mgnify:CR=1 FL=1
MENTTNELVTDTKVKIITSKNSPELAKKMKEASAYFMKINDQLYKDLANKWIQKNKL